jgi:Protein of unknown function (DUF2961).
MNGYNGLGASLGTLSELSHARSRSISPENFSGEKSAGSLATDGTGARAARELGVGWKISPSVIIQAGETRVLADIEGPGAITHIWMTPTGHYRHSILRVYWEGSELPSVECPVGDFFANGWGEFAQVNSLPVCVNPGSGLNSYWIMPFHKHCRVTMTNIAPRDMVLYYSIDYSLTELSQDLAYFHAQFRRVNPLPYKQVYITLDGVEGWGHYVGTYMAWGSNNNLWWGEGEVKFYLDDDVQPSIVTTGTEDYFCGSYNFDPSPGHNKGYMTYTTAYSGFPQLIRPSDDYHTQMRFGLYRWHIPDPIRFEKNIKVEIQPLGWRSNDRYLPLQDDLASVAFWYQTLPTAPFPDLPAADELEII